MPAYTDGPSEVFSVTRRGRDVSALLISSDLASKIRSAQYLGDKHKRFEKEAPDVRAELEQKKEGIAAWAEGIDYDIKLLRKFIKHRGRATFDMRVELEDLIKERGRNRRSQQKIDKLVHDLEDSVYTAKTRGTSAWLEVGQILDALRFDPVTVQDDHRRSPSAHERPANSRHPRSRSRDPRHRQRRGRSPSRDRRAVHATPLPRRRCPSPPRRRPRSPSRNQMYEHQESESRHRRKARYRQANLSSRRSLRRETDAPRNTGQAFGSEGLESPDTDLDSSGTDYGQLRDPSMPPGRRTKRDLKTETIPPKSPSFAYHGQSKRRISMASEDPQKRVRSGHKPSIKDIFLGV
jgi:hypothetical protein